jgi:hypothetical protein
MLDNVFISILFFLFGCAVIIAFAILWEKKIENKIPFENFFFGIGVILIVMFVFGLAAKLN